MAVSLNVNVLNNKRVRLPTPVLNSYVIAAKRVKRKFNMVHKVKTDLNRMALRKAGSLLQMFQGQRP